MVKKFKPVIEDEINRLRKLCDTKQALLLIAKRNEKDHFDLLVRAEVTIEDYLYVHGSATSPVASRVDELKTVRKHLDTIINTATHKAPKGDSKSYQKSLLLEAKILMMKLLYIFGEMDSIDNYFVESDLDAAVTQFTNEHNSRMLRMAAEAYAIKGLQAEYFMASENSNGTSNKKSARNRGNPKKYLERSTEVCFTFLKCLDSLRGYGGGGGSVANLAGTTPTSPVGGMWTAGYVNQNSGSAATSPVSLQMGSTTAPNVTNFLEYAVHRVPSMLFMEENISGSVGKLRDDLQKSEIRHASELRALLARQLAEILMRFVSDHNYTCLLDPSQLNSLARIATEDLTASLGVSGRNSAARGLMPNPGANISQSTNNLTKMKSRTSTFPNMEVGGHTESYVPQSRMEEILLLLLITEALISKELVLDMGSEHEVLRTKKLKEEKFVLDLLTIVLSNGQQYNLLSQAVERGMSVAFEDKEMWFKYALSLISARKYARGIIVLRECAKLDPTNYLYHSLIARVALQNIREPLVAIESLEKALEASGKSADMTCYDEAKIYLLMAVAYAMKAESSTVNISDKNQAWEAARNHFAKAYELDDMEPIIAYNYALCLAKARRISEACRLIRDYEDFPPAQELNILLLTSMKKYVDALDLVASYLEGNAENLTLLFLKTAIEEKMYGPSVAARNLKTMAVQMTRLGFPSFFFSDGQSVTAASVDRQLSAASVGGGMGVGVGGGAPTLTAQNTLNSTLGRSQASELFTLRVNSASIDGWNTDGQMSRSGAAASMSFLDNYTLSEGGLASSMDSPRHSGSHQMGGGGGNSIGVSPEDDVNLNIWIVMLEFCVKTNNHKQAKDCLQEFTKCIRSESAMYHYHYANGILAEEDGNMEDSKSFYKQALVFNPRAVDARVRLATCLMKEDSLECGEKVLRECIQLNPYDEKSWGLLGEILKEKCDETGASECMRTACNLERTAPIKCFDTFLNWAI